MDPGSFSLSPFRGEEPGPVRKIAGTIVRHADRLSLGCAFLCDPAKVAIPPPAEAPARRDRLWEETCLELFFGVRGSERYWEFHLSPAGHWNVFRFASYRKEGREEAAFSSLPFRVLSFPTAVRFSLGLEIGKIVPARETIEAAVCAVVRTVGGGICHWALSHPGPRPDFHRRDGFTLRLPGGRPPAQGPSG